MDFQNFRLFVMSNTFPDIPPGGSNMSDNTGGDSDDSDKEWSQVSQEDCTRFPGTSRFSPFHDPSTLGHNQSHPNYMDYESSQQSGLADRMTHSLDLGHGTLGSELEDIESSHSIPWAGSGSRTLERIRKGAKSSGPGTDQTEKIKTRLMSVWNNMKYGKYWYI